MSKISDSSLKHVRFSPYIRTYRADIDKYSVESRRSFSSKKKKYDGIIKPFKHVGSKYCIHEKISIKDISPEVRESFDKQRLERYKDCKDLQVGDRGDLHYFLQTLYVEIDKNFQNIDPQSEDVRKILDESKRWTGLLGEVKKEIYTMQAIVQSIFEPSVVSEEDVQNYDIFTKRVILAANKLSRYAKMIQLSPLELYQLRREIKYQPEYDASKHEHLFRTPIEESLILARIAQECQNVESQLIQAKIDKLSEVIRETNIISTFEKAMWLKNKYLYMLVKKEQEKPATERRFKSLQQEIQTSRELDIKNDDDADHILNSNL